MHVPPIDQEQLAALLSGSLTGRDRQALLARLAADEDGRLLLRMALQALEAVDMRPEASERREHGNRPAA